MFSFNSKGLSGFGIIIIILLLLVIGYVGYQIFRIEFAYRAAKSKVEEVVEFGPTRSDADILRELLIDLKEVNVKINPDYDTIYIDRSIPDSFRIYVAYNDSSNIFGLYTYSRHLVIDVVKPIKIGL